MLQFPIAMTPRTEPARALAWLSPVIAFALTVFTPLQQSRRQTDRQTVRKLGFDIHLTA